MTNPEFELAEEFALRTQQHIFLTGKAGSGKTTLLRSIARSTYKNFVIVAPTGVAAINAGGVTIHSMFNLPLTAFIPSNDYVNLNYFTNQTALLNHLKFRKEKLRIIQEMELLIIDEVSMVRADVLDAVDFIMQRLRHNNEPFGGVQVMLIGDMHQLPPVIKDHEWEVLSRYYKSIYFFDSKAWNAMDAVEIELKKIYRQSDERFLNLLNNIRHQQMEEDDYELLKSRYVPSFKPTEPGYILLTTHNYRADVVNGSELKKLPGPSFFYEAEIDGDFPEHIYPVDRKMELRVGAQVMFTKNDVSGNQDYYNGKIATVKSLTTDTIIVTFNDTNTDFVAKRERWENINYSMDEASQKIEKKTAGEFLQYPFRLAWAITIHKSQGLTFDKVIIDAGSSFASGQVYVALSRCTSLYGIVLHSIITQNVLYGDTLINAFSNAHHSHYELTDRLEIAKAAYAQYQLKRLFNFEKLKLKMDDWFEMINEKKIADKETALEVYHQIEKQISEIITTAEKFQPQLERLIAAYQADNNHIIQLKERCSKAIEYFTENIYLHLVTTIHRHINSVAYKSKMKRYVQQVRIIEQNFMLKIKQLYDAGFLDEKLFAGEKKYLEVKIEKITTSVTSDKKEKGGTYKDTLDLYKQGKTVDEIAIIRSLARSTIMGHLSRWIETGEVDILRLMPKEKIETIEKTIEEIDANEVTTLRARLGDAYDYNDLRMVMNWVKWKRKGEL